MNWAFRIARVRGIDIKIHVTFFLILALGAFQWSGSVPDNPLAGALFGGHYADISKRSHLKKSAHAFKHICRKETVHRLNFCTCSSKHGGGLSNRCSHFWVYI